MSEIYLADRECKVSANEALQEIDKQYLCWGWNTEQTTLDLVDYAKALESQLAEARLFRCHKCQEILTPYIDEDEFHGDLLAWFCACEPRDLPILEKMIKEQGDE